MAKPLWTAGRLRLRLITPDGHQTITEINRPFAIIGRSSSADLTIDHPNVSLRHVYLHLEDQGVFAVDLASRSGILLDGAPGDRRGFLHPGRGLELAGHRVELVDATLDQPVPTTQPSETPVDPLNETSGSGLTDLTISGSEGSVRPTSRLTFLGSGHACAIRVPGPGVTRVHAALVRAPEAAFIVDLVGENLAINGQSPTIADRLNDGDLLVVGNVRFHVRIRPSLGTSIVRPETTLKPASALTEPSPTEIRGQLLEWAAQAFDMGQQELARSQKQFQRSVVGAVRQLYRDQAELFERHMERIDRLQHELAELRAQITEQPRALSQPRNDELPPLDLPRTHSTSSEGQATSWLLNRVQDLEEQIDQETRSTWRDLFLRNGGTNRP